MDELFRASIPKDEHYPSEDVIEVNSPFTRLALSDGASESYDSKAWASILASRYLDNPDCNASWVEEAIVYYEQHHTIENQTWSKLAAYERGSFATLLGVVFERKEYQLSICGIGDSIAALIDGERLVYKFPDLKSAEFSNRPLLLSTNRAMNAMTSDNTFWERRRATWNMAQFINPLLLCMTDALGQWFLKHYEDGNMNWRNLASMRSVEDFRSLVVSEQASKALRVDDTSLVVIQFARS